MSESAPIYLTIPQNVNQQSDRDRFEQSFPKKTMLTCSILQLICAGMAALTQVRGLKKSIHIYEYFEYRWFYSWLIRKENVP